MSCPPPPGLLPRFQDFVSLWHLASQIGDGGQGEVYTTFPQTNNKHYTANTGAQNQSLFVTKIIALSSQTRAIQRIVKYYLFVQQHKLLNIYGLYHDLQNKRLLIVMQRLSHELKSKYLIPNKATMNLRFSRPGYIYINHQPSIKKFILQIATQLNTIHSHHCIHFDLKPSNIMFNHQANRWCIIDYDLMKKISTDNIENGGTLRVTHYRGTQSWTAPEMSTRASTDNPSFISCKADIFSFGLLILYVVDYGFQPYLLQHEDFANVHCKELVASHKWRRDKVYFDKLLRNGDGDKYLQNYLFQLKADYIITHQMYRLLKNMLLFDVQKRFSITQILKNSWLNT